MSDRTVTGPLPTSGRRWLDQAEAAEYLGVTPRTIRNYIARGVIRGRRLRGSRLVRIDRHEIDAAMKTIPSARCISGDAA